MMHLFLNISKDLLRLWKGKNKHLEKLDVEDNDFVIDQQSWLMIDKELSDAGKGTCHSIFGPKPRQTSVFATWKAAGLNVFFTSYALVVLESNLPQRYWNGLRLYCSLNELCSRPFLSQSDTD